jgi:hypothetical protein
MARVSPVDCATDRAAVLVATVELNPSGVAAAAAAGPELVAALCRNRRAKIPDDVWADLWARRLPAAVAGDLVARPLAPHLVERVLADESRPTVVARLLTRNPPSASQLDGLLGRRYAGAVAGAVPSASRWGMSPDRWRRWCLAAGGELGLRWLADHPDVDPAPYLADPAWVGRPSREVTVLVAQLLRARPDAIAAVCGPDVHPLLAREAAASHLLAGRADLAAALASRDPADHDTPTGAEALWELWVTLLENPATPAGVARRLAEHFTEVRSRPGTYFCGLYSDYTTVGGDQVTPSSARGLYGVAERRCAAAAAGVMLHTASAPVGDVAVLRAAARGLLPRNRWLGARSLVALPLYAEFLAGSPQVPPAVAEVLAETLGTPGAVRVLGVDRCRDLLRHLGVPSFVRHPGRRRRPAGQSPRRPATHVPAGEALPVYRLGELDDATARRVGGSLDSPAQWRALFSLLSDADPAGGENLEDLLSAARAIAP